MYHTEGIRPSVWGYHIWCCRASLALLPVSVHIDYIGGTRRRQNFGLTVDAAVVIYFMGCSIPIMSVIV